MIVQADNTKLYINFHTKEHLVVCFTVGTQAAGVRLTEGVRLIMFYCTSGPGCLKGGHYAIHQISIIIINRTLFNEGEAH